MSNGGETVTGGGAGGDLDAGRDRRAPRAVLERSARFTASHHYRHPAWSNEKNQAVFGALSEPHDHDYRVTVWVAGEMESVTGFVTSLPALDEMLEELFGPLAGGDLNRFVPEFATGELLPSCENLARWTHRELSRRLAPAQVVRVRVAESDDLAAEYPAPVLAVDAGQAEA